MHPSDNIFDPHQLFSGLIWESVISHSGVNLPTPALTNTVLLKWTAEHATRRHTTSRILAPRHVARHNFGDGFLGRRHLCGSCFRYYAYRTWCLLDFLWEGAIWGHSYTDRGPTKHGTGPHRTAPYPKILGDGIDQTPQRTGDPDTLSQRGYGPTTLP